MAPLLKKSRRGFLASLWSIVNLLTAVAFIVGLLFSFHGSQDQEYQYYDQEEAEEGEGAEEQEKMEIDPELAVTSRAMAFAASWTAVLATLLSIFGTVILGWQSPTGKYYTCCSSQVHRTTPMALGSFIGALVMFANQALLCSLFFGEFQVRDYREGEERAREGQIQYIPADRTSLTFSIVCMFLTILYGGFAALVYTFSHAVLEELANDVKEEFQMASPRTQSQFVRGYDGYIAGDTRFDVRRKSPGFVSPGNPTGALA